MFIYYSHAPESSVILERLARERPTTLACMHGSAWRGDGAMLLRELSTALVKTPHTSGRQYARCSPRVGTPADTAGVPEAITTE